MIVLGIDTSGYANNIGVIDDGRVLADFTFEARTDSLEKIVANIDYALRTARLYLDDVYGIGVGLGPGSWTGIRVGVTVGKMLAFSANRLVCGIPSLEALAYNARNESSLICAVINAGTRDTIYAAFYRAQNSSIERCGDYYVGGVPGLSQMVTEPAVIVGPEAESYSAQIKQSMPISKISTKALTAVPHGSAVACLAANRLEKGESDDVLSLTPLYLKESTARAYLSRYSGAAGKRE